MLVPSYPYCQPLITLLSHLCVVAVTQTKQDQDPCNVIEEVLVVLGIPTVMLP